MSTAPSSAAAAILMALALSGAWSSAALNAQLPDLSGRLGTVLRARFPANGAPPRLAVEGQTFQGSPDLACFYERRQYAPAWSDGGALRPAVEELLAALAAAREDGLRAEDYRVAPLRRLVAAVRSRPDPGGLADVDLLLSDAFLTFAAHLHNGKVNPAKIYGDCALAPDADDLASVLEEALRGGRVRAALAALAPPQTAYALLREALQRYRQLALRGGPEPVSPGPTLRLGAAGERVLALRTRLSEAAVADAAEPVSSSLPADVFDESLAAAVRRFQERHGLEPDGAAGRATLAELNQRPEDHVRQIEVNLERWRWLPHDLGRRYVLVNIAAFRLDAVEDGRLALAMRVIVGKPYTRTPMFSSEMRSVILNPSWYVPRKIAVNELLPKVARDSSYLAREGYEILPGGGIRQRPGPQNALGRIKFVFPNRFDVYLHDTPARTLFSRTVRTFSHGCIRVEKPLELAVWVLRDDPRWNEASIVAGIEAGRERTLPLPRPDPVRVQVGYWTAWVGDDGMLRLGPDVYQRDAELGRLLAAQAGNRQALSRRARPRRGATLIGRHPLRAIGTRGDVPHSTEW